MNQQVTAAPMVFKIPPDDVAPYGALSDREIMLMRIAAKWAMYAVAIRQRDLLQRLEANQVALDEKRQAVDENYQHLVLELQAEVARAESRGLKDGMKYATVSVDVDGFKQMVLQALTSPTAVAFRQANQEAVLRKVVRAEVLEALSGFTPAIDIKMPDPAPITVNVPAPTAPARESALVSDFEIGTRFELTKDGLEVHDCQDY